MVRPEDVRHCSATLASDKDLILWSIGDDVEAFNLKLQEFLDYDTQRCAFWRLLVT